jgi:hypothetical protein
MKKFIRRIQQLSEQASELKEAIQSVPPKVAEIREAVTMTASEMQQLTADVERNVSDLKIHGRDHLVEALHEVNGSVGVFEDVGYELGEIELELSPVPRLIVHLNRVDDVHDSILRSVIAANKDRKITHALLTAVQQAESTADRVDISGLVYYKLLSHIGPVPAVRLCWMPEEVREEVAAGLPTANTECATAPCPGALPASYGKDSFFGRTKQEETTPTSIAAAGGEASSSGSPSSTSKAPTRYVGTKSYRSGGTDWGASSLEQFKKMPSVSKYKR